MRDRFRRGWMSCPMPKFRGRFSMRGFCGIRGSRVSTCAALPLHRSKLRWVKVFRLVTEHTFAVFLLPPAFPWGKGAGAAFLLGLGGCH